MTREAYHTNTPASIDTSVEGGLDETGVVSTRSPFGVRIAHPETGFSGMDFVPQNPTAMMTEKNVRSAVPDSVKVLVTEGVDFMPGPDQRALEAMIEKQIEHLTKEIMDQKAEENDRFYKAKAELKRQLNRKEENRDKDKLEVLTSIVERGVPMTMERAKKLAERAVYAKYSVNHNGS